MKNKFFSTLAKRIFRFKEVKTVSILLIPLFLLYLHQLNAQDHALSIRKLSVDDGLSNGTVNAIMQDSLGFMWIGTNRGLNRYDGYRFEVLLEGQAIYDLEVGKGGEVWIAADKGLYNYNIIDGTLALDTFFNKYPIYCLEKGEKGDLLLAENLTIYSYSSRSLMPKRIFDIHSVESHDTVYHVLGIEDFATDKEGHIWVAGKTSGLIKLDTIGTVQEQHYLPPFLSMEVFVDENDLVWASTDYLLFYKKPFEEKFRQLLAADQQVFPTLSNVSPIIKASTDSIFFHKIQKDKQGNYWLFKKVDTNHLYKYDIQAEQLQEFEIDLGNFSQIYTTYVDRYNILWMGTNDGIVLIPSDKKQFQQYLYTSLDGSGRSVSTRGMAEDMNGLLYVATYEGLFNIDFVKDSIFRVPIQKNDGSTIWNDDRCYQLLEEDTCLWCASESFGLLKYHENSQKIERYKHGDGWLMGISLLRTVSGSLWLGTLGDLYLVDEVKKTLTPSRDIGLDFSNHGIMDLHQSRNGDIWIVTRQGLYQVDSGFKRIKAHYTADATDKPVLNTNDLLDIHEDQEGILWLGTKGGGLNRLDPVTGDIQVFTKESHGLSDNIVCSILQSDENHLWVGSYNGLMQFNTNTHEVQSFFEKDGLTHSEFNHASAFKDSKGNLYFGGIKGINAFDPSVFDEKKGHPPMLTSFMQYDPTTGKLIDKTVDVRQNHSIRLNYTDRFFNLHFASSDYQDPANNRYTYRIVGLDHEWNELGYQNQLRLNKPPPGDYEIQIRALGSSGSWSPPLSLALHVNEAFYKKTWFIIAVVFFTVLLVYTLFRLRFRQLKQAKLRLEKTVTERTREIAAQKAHIEVQANKLQALDRLKSRFFANISHELRTPLTLIQGHTENLLQHYAGQEPLQTELKVAQQNSTRLLGLVEEILDLSKLESGKLKLHEKPVQLHALLNRVADAYHSLLYGKKVRLGFTFDLPEQLTVRIDEDKVEKVLYNLLSNAVKFTEKGSIILETREIQIAGDPFINIVVQDTGRGIHSEDLPHIFDRFYQSSQANAPVEGGTGIGLALAKELAGLMGGYLEVSSEWGKGTCFVFKLPKKEVEAKEPIAEDTFPVLKETPKVPPTNGIGKNPAYKKQTPTVLVVEDHPDMRAFICKLLGPHYKIKEAADGKEALKKLKRYSIDLVISDVMMPRMDGFALLEALKAEEKWRGLPVVMLTARAAAEDKLHALRIGVNDYLTKPFQKEELLVRIDNLLKNRKQRLEWQQKIAEEEGKEATVSADDRFVQQAETTVKKELGNANFNVIDLAEALTVSQRQLTRKVRSTTGLSPLQFIREVRLQEARRMLENKEKETVAEVMYAIGIQTGGHFSEIYHKRFGKKPSSYFG